LKHWVFTDWVMWRKERPKAQSHYAIRPMDASALEANSSLDVMVRT
jgi:hypothetical protein